jgi:arylsulfatase A-like enzyme
LIIITDDQRADTLKVMPQTKRWLGQRGVRFTNAFVTTPLCCPARASVLTGQYAHNHRVWGNNQAFRLDERSTLQRYLNDAGYSTAIVGKYLNRRDPAVDPPYFDKWAIYSPPTYSSGYYKDLFNVNGAMQTIDQYSTGYIGDQTISFLEDFEEADERPWFMYVAPFAPHAPFTAEEEYARAPVGSWDGNPAVREQDRSDKPPWVKESLGTLADGRSLRRQQLRTLLSVDDLMGAVYQALEGLDEKQNTLVFFLSDNGFQWGEHGLGRKGASPYTQDVKVPFFMSWPGRVPQGEKDHRLVTNLDIAPTVLEAASIKPAPDYPLDGRSLMDLRRTRILMEYRWGGLGKHWASIRTGAYQYVEYYDPNEKRRKRNRTIIFREYYDLKTDPWQLRNLLHNQKRGGLDLGALHRQLKRHRFCQGPACP